MKIKDIARGLIPHRIWQTLRNYRIRHNINLFVRRTVEHNYGDNHFKILIADCVGEGW